MYLRHLYNMNRVNAVNELHRILWNCPAAMRQATLVRYGGEEHLWIEAVLASLNNGATQQGLKEMQASFTPVK